MLGRTRLYQPTGSPLIQGRIRRRPRRAPVLVALVVAVLIAGGAYLYFFVLR